MENQNVLIVGVGGQGTILASRLLSDVLQKKGYDVKVSEIHGMSQRGGSVTTQIRFGEKVHSPIIKKKGADYILAFEKLEAIRAIDFLAPKGTLIVNDQRIDPMPVISGKVDYPENVLERLEAASKKVIACDALQLAQEAGSAKAVNVVLLGIISNYLPVAESEWQDTIEQIVPARFLELNLKAFELGRNCIIA